LDLAQPPESWPDLPPCKAAVLCAAITNLDQCRRDSRGTRKINVEATLVLARRLADSGAFVTFVSSNLVFDGSRPLRKPDDPACPRMEYGRQKAEVEAGLAALGDRAAIVRLTKVLHKAMPLIRNWTHSLAMERPITPFHDLICSPISLDATVAALAGVTEKQLPGVWQLSARDDISYEGIANKLAIRLNARPDLIQTVSALAVSSPEHLASHSTLDASRSREELGFEWLDSETALDRILA
jgi:dTDP-4-dehydrorhamnose reductase